MERALAIFERDFQEKDMKDSKWEKMPQKLEWQEEMGFFPIFINRKTFMKIKSLDKDKLIDFCIKSISDSTEYTTFTIDRDMLLEQIETLFDMMSDKVMCYNTCLILVPLNHMSEVL